MFEPRQRLAPPTQLPAWPILSVWWRIRVEDSPRPPLVVSARSLSNPKHRIQTEILVPTLSDTRPSAISVTTGYLCQQLREGAPCQLRVPRETRRFAGQGQKHSTKHHREHHNCRVRAPYQFAIGRGVGSRAVLRRIVSLRAGQSPMARARPICVEQGSRRALLYALLAEAGYFSKDLLPTLRKLGSPLEGHPNMRRLPGVEASTGSLGQGLSIGIGQAPGDSSRRLPLPRVRAHGRRRN